jgi:hypothetical protein
MMSNWYNLEKEEIRKIPPKPGVYKISRFDKDDNPIEITRFFGIDKEGIIDIGESHNLRERLMNFKRNIENGKGGHMAGWRYYFLKLHNKVPILKFNYEVCNTKEEAYKKEHAMMKKYLDEHKELPPLNYKYNWSED